MSPRGNALRDSNSGPRTVFYPKSWEVGTQIRHNVVFWPSLRSIKAKVELECQAIGLRRVAPRLTILLAYLLVHWFTRTAYDASPPSPNHASQTPPLPLQSLTLPQYIPFTTMTDTSSPGLNPSILQWTLSFLLVGAAWGLTTPFIRRGALSSPSTSLSPSSSKHGFIRRKIIEAAYTVWDLLRRPAYSIPLLINLTGSVWFFVLVGKAELSLTVPITNSLAFLFTVLGEWLADRKVIGRGKWEVEGGEGDEG
jgi:hypothetical protein